MEKRDLESTLLRMGKREYSFADGARPRMGKRQPVQETDLLDGGKAKIGGNTRQKNWWSPLFSKKKCENYEKYFVDSRNSASD